MSDPIPLQASDTRITSDQTASLESTDTSSLPLQSASQKENKPSVKEEEPEVIWVVVSVVQPDDELQENKTESPSPVPSQPSSQPSVTIPLPVPLPVPANPKEEETSLAENNIPLRLNVNKENVNSQVSSDQLSTLRQAKLKKEEQKQSGQTGQEKKVQQPKRMRQRRHEGGIVPSPPDKATPNAISAGPTTATSAAQSADMAAPPVRSQGNASNATPLSEAGLREVWPAVSWDAATPLPMATSTPTSRKRPANGPSNTHLSSPKIANVQHMAAPGNSVMMDLTADDGVSVTDFASLWSDVSQQHTPHKIQTSTMVSIAPGAFPKGVPSSTLSNPQQALFSPPFATSTPVFHRSPEEATRSLFSQPGSGGNQVLQQAPVTPLGFTRHRTSMENVYEQSHDSGVGSLMVTPVMEGGLDADQAATCSSWATSEDSNLVMGLDGLSQGSAEENSNSQVDDGELNTSLTKMVWLKDFALANRPPGTEHLFSPEQPINRRLETRNNKIFCNCKERPNKVMERKPPYKYKDMIEMALLTAPNFTMTSQDIRSWLIQTFAFFKQHRKCQFWQNAIRHNLSSNDCFVRSTTQKRHWALDTSLSSRCHIPNHLPYTMTRLDPALLSNAAPVERIKAPRIGYQPILPRSAMPQLLSYNQPPAAAFVPPQASPMMLPVLQPAPGSLLGSIHPLANVHPFSAMNLPPLAKLPLPPLSATVAAVRSSQQAARKKGRGVTTAVGRGKKRTKSVNACDTADENNLLVQAAIQSGLRSMDESDVGVEDVEQLVRDIANGQGLFSVTGDIGCAQGSMDAPTPTSVMPKTQSLPASLSQPGMPFDLGELVRGEKGDLPLLSRPQQQSRVRRKQNLYSASTAAEPELIFTGSRSGRNSDAPVAQASRARGQQHTADTLDPARSDTSLNLTGPQAAELQLSPLVTPPRRSPRLPLMPGSPDCVLLDTSTPLGKGKVGVGALPSPIAYGRGSSSSSSAGGGQQQAAPLEDSSLMDMLDSLIPPHVSPVRDPTLPHMVGTPDKDGDLGGLGTPSSSSLLLKTSSSSQHWSDQSLGLLTTPTHLDLGISSALGHLWDLDLSMTDHSPRAGRAGDNNNPSMSFAAEHSPVGTGGSVGAVHDGDMSLTRYSPVAGSQDRTQQYNVDHLGSGSVKWGPGGQDHQQGSVSADMSGSPLNESGGAGNGGTTALSPLDARFKAAAVDSLCGSSKPAGNPCNAAKTVDENHLHLDRHRKKCNEIPQKQEQLSENAGARFDNPASRMPSEATNTKVPDAVKGSSAVQSKDSLRGISPQLNMANMGSVTPTNLTASEEHRVVSQASRHSGVQLPFTAQQPSEDPHSSQQLASCGENQNMLTSQTRQGFGVDNSDQANNLQAIVRRPFSKRAQTRPVRSALSRNLFPQDGQLSQDSSQSESPSQCASPVQAEHFLSAPQSSQSQVSQQISQTGPDRSSPQANHFLFAPQSSQSQVSQQISQTGPDQSSSFSSQTSPYRAIQPSQFAPQSSSRLFAKSSSETWKADPYQSPSQTGQFQFLQQGLQSGVGQPPSVPRSNQTAQQSLFVLPTNSPQQLQFSQQTWLAQNAQWCPVSKATRQLHSSGQTQYASALNQTLSAQTSNSFAQLQFDYQTSMSQSQNIMHGQSNQSQPASSLSQDTVRGQFVGQSLPSLLLVNQRSAGQLVSPQQSKPAIAQLPARQPIQMPQPTQTTQQQGGLHQISMVKGEHNFPQPTLQPGFAPLTQMACSSALSGFVHSTPRQLTQQSPGSAQRRRAQPSLHNQAHPSGLTGPRVALPSQFYQSPTSDMRFQPRLHSVSTGADFTLSQCSKLASPCFNSPQQGTGPRFFPPSFQKSPSHQGHNQQTLAGLSPSSNSMGSRLLGPAMRSSPSAVMLAGDQAAVRSWMASPQGMQQCGQLSPSVLRSRRGNATLRDVTNTHHGQSFVGNSPLTHGSNSNLYTSPVHPNQSGIVGQPSGQGSSSNPDSKDALANFLSLTPLETPSFDDLNISLDTSFPTQQSCDGTPVFLSPRFSQMNPADAVGSSLPSPYAAGMNPTRPVTVSSAAYSSLGSSPCSSSGSPLSQHPVSWSPSGGMSVYGAQPNRGAAQPYVPCRTVTVPSSQSLARNRLAANQLVTNHIAANQLVTINQAAISQLTPSQIVANQGAANQSGSSLAQQLGVYHPQETASGSQASHMSAFFDSLINTTPVKQQCYFNANHPSSHLNTQ